MCSIHGDIPRNGQCSQKQMDVFFRRRSVMVKEGCKKARNPNHGLAIPSVVIFCVCINPLECLVNPACAKSKF